MKGIYKIFLASMLIFLSIDGFSQTAFGLRGGANFSKVRNSDFEYKSGLHIGTFLEIPVCRQLSFQPEFVFSQKGGRTDLRDNQYYNSLDQATYNRQALTLNYFDINALARLNVYDGFYLILGPQLSVLTYSKLKFNNGIGEKEKDGYNFVEGENRLNFGVAAGAGYEFKNGISLGIRKEMGISPVIEGSKMRNSLIQLTAGFHLFSPKRYEPTTNIDLTEEGSVNY